ncbi:MAG: hypothetical protein ACE1ZW_01510 [Nitrospirales bacterium]|nr:hypothetical protein [Nitrospirota bacterium]
MIFLALFCLIVLPIGMYRWGKRHYPEKLWFITGVSFGLIASPFSMGLYGFYFMSSLGFIPGMLGFVLTMLHAGPGFEILGLVGLREDGNVVSNMQRVKMEVINGVVWGILYGIAGSVVDNYLASRKQSKL